MAALVAATSTLSCERSEAPSRPDTAPLGSDTLAGAAGEASPLRVGEAGRVDDLTVTVQEVGECAPRGYERAAVDQAGAILLGVRVAIERDEREGSVPPARYEGAPRMLLADGQGRQYRYTLRGTCTPELRGMNLQAGSRLRGWVTFQIPSTAKDLTLVYPVDAPTHGHPGWAKEPGIARNITPPPTSAGAAPEGLAEDVVDEATANAAGAGNADATATDDSPPAAPGPARFVLGR